MKPGIEPRTDERGERTVRAYALTIGVAAACIIAAIITAHMVHISMKSERDHADVIGMARAKLGIRSLPGDGALPTPACRAPTGFSDMPRSPGSKPMTSWRN